MKNVSVDTEEAFKSLWMTNDLNGSEDFKVSDKLYNLVGEELIKFRESLMAERSPKTLDELVKKIIPPKGGLILESFSVYPKFSRKVQNQVLGIFILEKAEDNFWHLFWEV